MKSYKLINRFCLEVESICASLKSLELALSDVRSCEPFIQIIKLILEIGNFLNGKEDSGFNILEFLPKLHDLKDCASNKPLLYHVIKASQCFKFLLMILIVLKGTVKNKLQNCR